MKFRAALYVFGLVSLVPALPAADATMLKLVMPDAKVVAGADFDRIKGSPFGQYALSMANFNEPGFQKFLAATGFDPRNDLREFLVASNSVTPTPGTANPGLVIVKGNFDVTKIGALASVQGATVTTYKGVKIVSGPANGGHPSPSAAFLDGLMAAGSVDSLKAAIDRQQGSQGIPAELAARIQSASSNYHAWGLTTVSPSEFSGKVPNANLQGAMKGDVIQGIENVSGGVRFGANVEFGGEALTRSDRDATALIDVMRFLISMVVSNAPQQAAGIGALAQSLQLTSNGATVVFSASLPEQDFENLLKAPQQMRGRGRVRPVSAR